MNHFAYAVCGGRNYIRELNFSLKFLKLFSDYPIIVVTDCSRNEEPINHDKNQIIDIKTPENLNNNEASQFLETSLHKILNMDDNNRYFYLDSDIIVINGSINNVFNYLRNYPFFAKDHYSLKYHSPTAMNCSCSNFFDYKKEKFDIAEGFMPKIKDDSLESRNNLNSVFSAFKNNSFHHIPDIAIYLFNRYIKPCKGFYLHEYYFNKKNRAWYLNNKLIDFDKKYYLKQLKKNHSIIQEKNDWFDLKGNKLIPEIPYCSHLSDFLKKHYNISLKDDFNLWNGGAFIFDKNSAEIMDYWHKTTIEMFDFKELKTKYIDQLSFIVTAIKFEISNKDFLPLKFNFITDIENKNVKFDEYKGYTYDNFKTVFKPAALHVYHHWGNKKWSIWQSVEKLGKEKNIIKD